MTMLNLSAFDSDWCAGPPGAAKEVQGDAHIALRMRPGAAKNEAATLDSAKAQKAS